MVNTQTCTSLYYTYYMCASSRAIRLAARVLAVVVLRRRRSYRPVSKTCIGASPEDRATGNHRLDGQGKKKLDIVSVSRRPRVLRVLHLPSAAGVMLQCNYNAVRGNSPQERTLDLGLLGCQLSTAGRGPRNAPPLVAGQRRARCHVSALRGRKTVSASTEPTVTACPSLAGANDNHVATSA